LDIKLHHTLNDADDNSSLVYFNLKGWFTQEIESQLAERV